ncbi:serine/arginine repetitive matrix protein 1-like [Lolium rigidum]|uniref:serine/arginine repetitive matrix protein 1-like n=1 Tax=Lolium rigidum TaxID=89674 RepID=UPI001F5CFF36|nr:serine/arginine repetitive matrix protein 1-like [Lolium rigidum]
MGMRCKRHPFQAGGGVCATCLRDRLLVLAAAQNDASSPAPSPAPAPPPPAAPAFPRSVSPYVSRRKSDSSSAALRSHHPSLLFFRTPQVGPSAPLEEGDIGYHKRRAGKFSVLSTLFGNHHHHHHRSDEDKAKDPNKNRSWLAGIIPRRRKKQPALPPSPPPRRSCRAVSNRGLSPERGSSGDDESSSPSGGDPDPPWRPTPSPMRKTPCRRRQTSGGMPSGLAVCLSPLVRPSPGRRRRAAPQPPDTFSAELRPSPLHAAAASVPRCRSRKLADGARFR